MVLTGSLPACPTTTQSKASGMGRQRGAQSLQR